MARAPTQPFSLERYLAHVGLAQAPSPTAEALIEITAAQSVSVPFENLSPYLGVDVAVDIDGVAAKILERGRGGYCFEVNTLLRGALEAVGYEVMPRVGRVFQDRGPPQGRTHYVLEVEADGRRWLADCGFGGSSLRYAMPLELDRQERQRDDCYRLRRDPFWGMVLQTLREDWQDLYAFDDGAFHPADVEMGNFYTNCSPTSRFRQLLIAARVTPTGRVTLRDRTFRRRQDDQADVVELASLDQLRQVLVNDFLLPEDELDLPALADRLFLSD